ncbi:hypothetical protein Tco_0440835, partial [Tanacetum coccineum]
MVTSEGIRANPKKTKAISELDSPVTLKDRKGRRLRRYFEAHPVKVITDQPIKNILSRTEASGKLAKYAVEIGTVTPPKIRTTQRN